MALAAGAAVARMSAAAGNRGGRALSELFDDESGPLKRRKTLDATGAVKVLPGAVCFFCQKTCNKSSELSWLYHLVGKAGTDKGCGWLPCTEAGKSLDDAQREKLRTMFEAKLKAKSEPERVMQRASPNRSSASAEHAEHADTPPQPTALVFPGADGGGEPHASGDSATTTPSTDPDVKLPELTPERRTLLTTYCAMMCFEGNISPHALVNNQSFYNFSAIALAGRVTLTARRARARALSLRTLASRSSFPTPPPRTTAQV